MLVAVAVLASACSGDKGRRSAQEERIDGSAATAAADAPLPPEVAVAKDWLRQRRSRLDRFTAAARATLDDGDCETQADAVRRAVGDFDEWVAEVAASPDRSLGEALQATAFATRATLAACVATDRPALSRERTNLQRALDAVGARRRVLDQAD
ncbi:MAG TPA: hypothetical protein VF230_10040 [Acidimicrobiales bacterium]